MLPLGNRSSAGLQPQESNGSAGAGPGVEAVVVPVVFALIFVVGVVGNTLVMVVIGRARPGSRGRTRGPRSPTNIFVVNLSAADLSFLLLCVPLHATIYSLPDWIFGAFLCWSLHFFSSVSMLVSIFTLVAMSVDRYVAVVLSGTGRCARSRGRALAGVCFIWVLSVLCSVPVAQHHVLTGHPSAPNSTFCWERWSGPFRQGYKVSVLVLGYLLPLLLISCCYAKVLFHLHKKMKNMSKKSEQSKRKTAQTVLLVVAAFAFCWLPHHVIVMWVEFGNFPLNDTTFALRIMSHCLSYGNSCINPILYAFLSQNFRQACRQVCSFHRMHSPPPGSRTTRLRTRRETVSMYSTTNI